MSLSYLRIIAEYLDKAGNNFRKMANEEDEHNEQGYSGQPKQKCTYFSNMQKQQQFLGG
jgi:hypothetical protein